ncbi:MAG: hypothetical protein KC620_24740, partial [Myxococcales bacterium]|nr:hypothetical protein [Myxococcales bacterium]
DWAAAQAMPEGIIAGLGLLHGIKVGQRLVFDTLDGAPLGAAVVEAVTPVACRCTALPGVSGPLRARAPGGPSPLWRLALDDAGLPLLFDADALLDEAGRAVVVDGQSFTVRVINEGGKRLHIALVSLDEADAATVLLPEPGTEMALAPFGRHEETFDAVLPPGAPTARERLVLVACTRPFDLRPAAGRAVPVLEEARCALRRLEILITRRGGS